MTHHCFIHTSILDSIVSDCPFPAICCTATKWNRILVSSSTFTAVLPASASDTVDNTVKWEALNSEQPSYFSRSPDILNLLNLKKDQLYSHRLKDN